MNVFRTFLSHRGPIHDIQQIPNALKVGTKGTLEAVSKIQNENDLTRFVTCSSDRTVRFWNFIDPSISPAKQ